MSDLVLDASLALQWFLVDEADRKYSLNVLASLTEKAGGRALIPKKPLGGPSWLGQQKETSHVAK